MRLDELDKENKRLERELQAADARWKKTEEELEDLREANADVAQLREKLARAEKKAEEVEQLVRGLLYSENEQHANYDRRNPKSQHSSDKTPICRRNTVQLPALRSRTRLRPTWPASWNRE